MVKKKKNLEILLEIEGPRLKLLRDLKNRIEKEEESLSERLKSIMGELGISNYSTGLVLLTSTKVPIEAIDPKKVYRDEGFTKKVFLSLVYIPKEEFERYCRKKGINPQRYFKGIEGYERLDVDFVPDLRDLERELAKLYEKMGVNYSPKKGRKKNSKK